jgi:hypothetical protein
MKNITCASCGCMFGIPDALYEAAKASENISFYCAYGHTQHFPKGDSEADKLRRERDRLAQQIAQRDDEIARQRSLRQATERQLSAAKGQVTKIKKRVGNGVCPCCNRTFGNLAAHMHSQHPDFTETKPEAAAWR